MITVQLSNSALCQLMLFDLIIACEGPNQSQGGRETLPERACELLELFRGRPQSDLAEIARHSGFLVSFDIDRAKAEAHRLDARNRDNEDREYFVRNGATYECCSAVLRMRLEDYRAMRERYFQAASSGGRPRMPNERERETICTDWARLKREAPDSSVRRRLKALHEIHRGWALNALTNILQDFGVLPAWDVLLQSGEDRPEVALAAEANQSGKSFSAPTSIGALAQLDKPSNQRTSTRLDGSSNRSTSARPSTVGWPPSRRTGDSAQ